jgi:hypothetical protein
MEQERPWQMWSLSLRLPSLQDVSQINLWPLYVTSLWYSVIAAPRQHVTAIYASVST